MAELIAGMFTASWYKRSQGRMARQATAGVIAATAAIGAWLLSERLRGGPWTVAYLIPALLGLAGVWFAFRVVNIPSFAEFLISVEAEMNKVTWPSKGELYRASLVVIVVIFLFTAILFAYDFALKLLVGVLLGD